MTLVAHNGGNSNSAPGVFAEDGTNGFIKFEDDQSLYNNDDAGNFMTGKGYNLIGMPLGEIRGGAHLNNFLSSFGMGGWDSSSDQQALQKGAEYLGVIWKSWIKK